MMDRTSCLCPNFNQFREKYELANKTIAPGRDKAHEEALKQRYNAAEWLNAVQGQEPELYEYWVDRITREKEGGKNER